jgi:chorismate-pyruvate lyase
LFIIAVVAWDRMRRDLPHDGHDSSKYNQSTISGFRRYQLRPSRLLSPMAQASICRPACDPADAFVEHLEPFQRLLLSTDGTVTTILAAYLGEPIGVELLGQAVIISDQPDARLEVGVGRRILCREVLLYGLSSGTLLVYARSRLVLDRLDAGVRADLLRGDIGIGMTLQKNRVETLRSKLECGMHPANSEVAKHFGPSMMCFRTYAIIASTRPLMVVHEEFPYSSSADPQLALADGRATSSRATSDSVLPRPWR